MNKYMPAATQSKLNQSWTNLKTAEGDYSLHMEAWDLELDDTAQHDTAARNILLADVLLSDYQIVDYNRAGKDKEAAWVVKMSSCFYVIAVLRHVLRDGSRSEGIAQ